MAFEEIVKTSPDRGKPDVHASYTVKPSDGVGTLRINKYGVDFLNKNNIQIHNEDRMKMFFDPQTLAIAFNQDKDGPFRFTVGKDKSYRLSYKDLSKKLKKSVEYSIQISKEYDLLFIPVNTEHKTIKQQENKTSTSNKTT